MTPQKGVLVISLDFELYWGLRDKIPLESYRENLLGVRSVIPAMLSLFEAYRIHATWATVGFLFYENRDELLAGLPGKRPGYENSTLSPYSHVNNIGVNEARDPFHYAASLIKMIASYPHQEIGTHTFSHYYSLEKGQVAAEFRSDLQAAIRAAQKYNLNLKSLVFPRNQVNHQYLPVCRELGIKDYRGNPVSRLYGPITGDNQSLVIRGLRLLDAYINLSGHNAYALKPEGSQPVNIPASRFLRPWNDALRVIEPLRLRRILSDLTYAAQNGLMYHLCWHPHNFGINQEKNLTVLEKILKHFVKLQNMHGMVSLNMRELAEKLSHETIDNQGDKATKRSSLYTIAQIFEALPLGWF